MNWLFGWDSIGVVWDNTKRQDWKFGTIIVTNPKTSFPLDGTYQNPAANCNAYHNHNVKDFQSRHFPQLSLGACFKWLNSMLSRSSYIMST